MGLLGDLGKGAMKLYKDLEKKIDDIDKKIEDNQKFRVFYFPDRTNTTHIIQLMKKWNEIFQRKDFAGRLNNSCKHTAKNRNFVCRNPFSFSIRGNSPSEKQATRLVEAVQKQADTPILMSPIQSVSALYSGCPDGKSKNRWKNIPTER